MDLSQTCALLKARNLVSAIKKKDNVKAKEVPSVADVLTIFRMACDERSIKFVFSATAKSRGQVRHLTVKMLDMLDVLNTNDIVSFIEVFVENWPVFCASAKNTYHHSRFTFSLDLFINSPKFFSIYISYISAFMLDGRKQKREAAASANKPAIKIEYL